MLYIVYTFVDTLQTIIFLIRKKATLEKINSPEWLLKRILIRFINDDRNRNFEGIYLWH